MNNILSEIWKFSTSAYAGIANPLYCIFLRAKLNLLNAELNLEKMYVKNSEKRGSSMFTDHFKEKIPRLTAERESLEAQIEILAQRG